MAYDSVQSVAARNVQCDLKLLKLSATGEISSPFSAENATYLRRVQDAYISQHPLGFLAASSPIIAQSMAVSALRADVILQLRAYNVASGDFNHADLQIAKLRVQSSDDFATAVPQIVTNIHREVLTTTRAQFQQMATGSQKLWGTGHSGQMAFQTRFQSAVRELDQALAVLDQGNTSEAFQLLQRTVANHRDAIQEFQWAGHVSDGLRFGTTVGIGMGAGFLAFWSGGATLGAMGVEAGAETASISLGAMVASMGVGGLTLTTANRLLNHMVFDTRLLASGSVTEKAADFTGEVLTNTAFMGFMPLVGAPLRSAALVISDSSFATRALMATSNVSYEFAAMTAFNVSTTGMAHVADPAGHPAISEILAPEALAHSFGVLLGMKGGNRTITWMANPRSFPGRVIRMPAFAMMGMWGDSVPMGRTVPVNATDAIVQSALTAMNHHVDSEAMLSALLMINAGVPASIITSQFLGLRPHTMADDFAIERLRQAATHPAIASLRSHIVAVGDMSPEFQAAHYFQEIMANMDTAVAHQTTVGFEYEFHPFGTSRDAVYQAVVQAFRDAKLEVEVMEPDGPSHFVYKLNKDKVLPVVWGKGMWRGLPFTTEILTGTGARVISVAKTPDDARSEVAPPTMPSLYEATPLLAEVMAEALGLQHVSSTEVVSTIRNEGHYEENYFFLIKADDFDLLHVDVTLLGNGRARLTGANGRLYDVDGVAKASIEIDYANQLSALSPEERVSRPDLRAIDYWLKENIADKAFATKNDVITGIKVAGLGRGKFEIVAEASPYQEAVTPILLIPEVTPALNLVNAFKQAGFGGTRAGYLIGMHIHAGVTEKVNGQFSAAPAVSLMRAFSQNRDAFRRIIPSQFNRKGFIQQSPQRFVRLILERNYMADPNNPEQILQFIADYAMHHPSKYGAMNLDNWSAHIVNEMGKAGVLKADGKPIAFSYTNASGERTEYKVSVRKEGDIFRAYRHFKAGELMEVTTDGDEIRATYATEVAITRVNTNLKPTAELRMPDTINDPEAVGYLARFWGTFVDHYGNGPFIP